MVKYAMLQVNRITFRSEDDQSEEEERKAKLACRPHALICVTAIRIVSVRHDVA